MLKDERLLLELKWKLSEDKLVDLEKEWESKYSDLKSKKKHQINSLTKELDLNKKLV